jgi:alpha-glucosidase
MSVAEYTASLLDQPHHDGSDLYVIEQPDAPGGEAVVRARVSVDVDTVAVRWVEDGEARAAKAQPDGDGWWIARFPVNKSITRYRWLLAGGDLGYVWLNGTGLVTHDIPDADDFVLSLDAAPAWHLESVVYEIFPDRFASSGLEVDAPEWAVRRLWTSCRRAAARTRRTSFSAATCAESRLTSTTSSSSARM